MQKLPQVCNFSQVQTVIAWRKETTLHIFGNFWERCMIAEMTVQFLPKFIFDVTDSKRDVKIKYFCKDDLYQELLLIKSLKSCGWRKVCKTYFQTTQNYPVQSNIIFYFT